MMADYDKMSIEELEAEQTKLWEEARKIQEIRGEVAAALDAKRRAANLETLVANVPDDVKRQIIATNGVPSGEAIGNIGG